MNCYTSLIAVLQKKKAFFNFRNKTRVIAENLAITFILTEGSFFGRVIKYRGGFLNANHADGKLVGVVTMGDVISGVLASFKFIIVASN